MTHNLTWKKPGQDEDIFKRHLITALSRSGVCVIVQDAHSNYLFIANLLDSWQVAPDQTPSDTSVFGPELAELLSNAKAEVLENAENSKFEISHDKDRHFQFIVEALPTGRDVPDLMITIIDLSEERRRETVLRTLLREVSHRSKNLLAIIQSIAAQTARHSDTLDQFLEKFRGRLYSLSHSQDLVTDSSWSGARFFELVRGQLHRYAPETDARITVEGENILLSPNAALHIGLALHELVVNAVSHGRLLSRQSGISVSCKHVTEDGNDMICFTWTEEVLNAGDREAEQSTTIAGTPQFGSTVLQRVVPTSVAGHATYDIGSEGITYRLVFPAKDNNE